MKLYTGCVENRQDPLKLGRCQVRVVGLHNHDKSELKTEDLPWAFPMQPLTSAAMSGIGHSPLGPVEGTWVVLIFRDDDEQQPIILGSIGGIPQPAGTIDQDNDQMILKEDGMIVPADQHTITDSNGNTVSNNSPDAAAEELTGLNPASSYTLSQSGIDEIKKNYPALSDVEIQDYVATNIAPAIKSAVKSPVSQSMFDGLCALAYNTTPETVTNSSMMVDLNSGKYLDAATAFNGLNPDTAQKDLFLKDGVPNVAGELSPVASTTAPVDSSTTSSGLTNDGTAMSIGFKDPNGKYPLYIGEPDTNKLARHEDIKKTIVYKKELTRQKNIPTSDGRTWNQSPIPYNSKYPYNHVFMTESGHVMEFDDTENSERIHLYHKSGTFTEIDANGTQVNKIIGDKYEILERNGKVYIKGKLDVTIDGDHNVKINNALNIEVMGNVNMNVHGDMNTNVRGDYKVKAQSISLESYFGTTNVLSSNTVNIESAAAMNLKAGATFNVDSVRTDLNNGTAGSANATDLTTPDAAVLTTPTFSELIVITRGAEAAAHYETPEEGDPTEFINKRIKDGTLAADEKDYGTQTNSASTSANTKLPLPASCNIINGMEKFTADLQLSPHFTLAALTKGGSRMPVAQQGLTVQEIVCNLKGLAENCLEPIINLYPGMVITSGFRRPGDVAQSSSKSQHYLGQAADIIIPGFSREKHYEAIQKIQQLIPYDQLLLEYSGANTVWIHVSFVYNAPRKQNFTMRDHQRVSDFGTYSLIT